MSEPNNQSYLEKVLKGLRNSQRAWQPGPPGLSRPQPPPQVIQENETAGNSLLRAINQERENEFCSERTPRTDPFFDWTQVIKIDAINIREPREVQ